MNKFIKCTMCGKEHPVEIIKEKATTYIKNEIVEYEETVYYCCNCDEDEAYYVPDKIMNENLLNARNAYRKKKGLLTSDEIVNFRESYGLSQTELSNIMGWGEVTVTRYETKAIQDETYDNALRNIIENPINMLKLLRKHKDKFDDYRFSIIESKVINYIKQNKNSFIEEKHLEDYYIIYSEPSIENGYTVLDIQKTIQIINYFAERITGLNKTTLMKLLWYSDCMSYNVCGKSMTGLVYEHEKYGALPIGHDLLLQLDGINVEETFDYTYSSFHILPYENAIFSLLSEKETNVLDSVVNKFKNYTATSIANYMHQETAYTKTNFGEIITFSYAKEIKKF